MIPDEERVRDFLADLKDLSILYGLVIRSTCDGALIDEMGSEVDYKAELVEFTDGSGWYLI